MKQFWPDLDALEAFLAVAEAGGFTAAAEELGASKVAVSRRVTELERRLGEKLFARTTRSVRLTEAGVAVRDKARAVLDEAQKLVDAVGSSSRDPSGRLRVVANQVLYEILLERVVVPFVQRHPRIELALDIASDPLRDARAAFDLALVVGPPPDSSMGSLHLGRAKIGCYCSTSYRDRFGTPASPSELSRHAIATVSGRRPFSWTFSRGARTETVAFSPRLTLSSHDLVMRVTAAGAAIARLPHFYVKRSAWKDALVPVLADWQCPPVAAYAVFPNRDRPSPPVRAFLAELREPLKHAASV